jgi:hypothetical protein
MRLMLINLIALIISVSALHVSANADISFSKDGTDTLSSMPLLDMDPIRNPANNRSHEIEILSQNLIETEVYLETVTNKTNDFLHYLPIYSLYRAKEYFLLI